MPMQFWSKLVQHRISWRLRLSQTGWILIIGCYGAATLAERMGKDPELVFLGLLAGIGLAITGAILNRRKRPTPRVTDTDIIITIEEIRVGDQRFRVSEIEYLDFLVNSYDGMPGPRVSPRGGIFGLLLGGRMALSGCDNKLLFEAKGKKHSYNFYLEDEMAMRRLGMLFREFYRDRLRFRERNRGGRTFLFEQTIDRKAFELAKRQEGYD